MPPYHMNWPLLVIVSQDENAWSIWEYRILFNCNSRIDVIKELIDENIITGNSRGLIPGLRPA
jgi:hypothetical protein